MARGRKSRKKWGRNWFQIEHEVTSSVTGIIILALALIVTLAHFGIASGWFSDLVVKGSVFLFGKAALLFPLMLFIIALYILFSAKPKVIGSATLGGTLVLLSLLGLVEIIGSFGNRLGGWVGYIISLPLYRSVGFWGSFVLFLAVFVSGLLITFRLPLKGYARKTFLPDEQEEKEVFEKQKGLVDKLSDAARLITTLKKKEPPPPPADETVTVNIPAGTDKPETTTKLPTGLKIMPAAKGYKFPPLSLLEDEVGSPVSGDIKANALIIQKTLEHFGIPVEMAEVNVGPTITQFTLKPATGIKLSRLTVLQSDLALALAARQIRMEAPIPGKSLVGIEIPNKRSMVVRLKGILEGFDSANQAGALNLAVGKDVTGHSHWTSLTKMPHLLIAGSTGSGKSIAINSMLLTFLFQHSPELLRLILIDPKRVELTVYNGIPHLLTPVITDPKKAIAALKWTVSEMERRFGVLSSQKVRDIAGYNLKQKLKNNGEFMPYLVIVIDELADLMAAYGREIEGTIVRLAQMARAVGIHIVVSTQRPSVEVLTGLIKANITSRMAFQVASQIDSRTILDMAGAEKLLGSGDMLFVEADFIKPKRIQGAFISENEVKRVVKFLHENIQAEEEERETELAEAIERSKSITDFSLGADRSQDDELYSQAKEVIIQAGRASASLLQRRLRVGYARAARLLDMLEEKGVVGPADGAKPREVFNNSEGENYDKGGNI